jgi:hypothetical protein
MDEGMNRNLVRTILEHAQDYPWTLQDIGVLGLRLDERREYRLQVWDPALRVGDPPVHDHPYDFTSKIVVGEMVNTVYREDRSGIEHRRLRYIPKREAAHHQVDTVRLSGTPTTIREGGTYSQLAHQLHDSHQLPGTVNVIRYSFKDIKELTVCLLGDAPFVSGQSRPATPDEIKEITAKALERFSPADVPPTPSGTS